MGGSGGALGELWEALAELREALGELWEGLYIQKLPINRPSGRYVTGWILKKRTKKIGFVHKCQQSKKWGEKNNQSPLTPLRRALFAP